MGGKGAGGALSRSLERCAARSPIDNPFEQTVACQSVGAMQAGAGNFADGKEVVDVRFPPAIDLDAAAQVVGGRHNRERLARHVDAVTEAGFVNIRESDL